MSILSDITIRDLCRLTEPFFDQAMYDNLVQEQRAWPLTTFACDDIKSKFRERAHRNRTQEELDAFIPMIAPFHPELIRHVEYRETRGGELVVDDRKIISKGTTSYGYDVSLTDDVKIFTNINATEIDPKRFDSQNCLAQAEVRTDVDGGRYVLIPPHSYMLGSTVEYFRVPRDVMIICVGKSTYARSGAIVNTTPIEPGFEGNVVIEIANTAPLPCRIYLDEGIAQFLFFRGDRPCQTSYGDRGGKYQFQEGVVMARV